MSLNNVIPQVTFLQKKCPYCYGSLGGIEILRRKVRKICRCKNCGTIINERNIIR